MQNSSNYCEVCMMQYVHKDYEQFNRVWFVPYNYTIQSNKHEVVDQKLVDNIQKTLLYIAHECNY